MDNTTFIFDGIKSEDMGLHNIRMSAGEYESPYIGARDIVESESAFRPINTFYGVNKRPIEFSLKFSTLDKDFDEKKRFEIARWLIQDDYKEFISTDYIGKVFRVIAVSEIRWIAVSGRKGYFEVGFRCDAPWAWSPISQQVHNLTSNPTTKTIEMWNGSNVEKYYYPELEFQLSGASTGLKLKNLSDGGREFEFTALNVGETVYVDNGKDKRRILSSVEGVYRYDNFNKNWFRLRQGRNLIEVTGECMLRTRMQFPLYT